MNSTITSLVATFTTAAASAAHAAHPPMHEAEKDGRVPNVDYSPQFIAHDPDVEDLPVEPPEDLLVRVKGDEHLKEVLAEYENHIESLGAPSDFDRTKLGYRPQDLNKPAQMMAENFRTTGACYDMNLHGTTGSFVVNTTPLNISNPNAGKSSWKMEAEDVGKYLVVGRTIYDISYIQDPNHPDYIGENVQPQQNLHQFSALMVSRNQAVALFSGIPTGRVNEFLPTSDRVMQIGAGWRIDVQDPNGAVWQNEFSAYETVVEPKLPSDQCIDREGLKAAQEQEKDAQQPDPQPPLPTGAPGGP